MQHCAVLGAINMIAPEHTRDAVLQLHDINQRVQFVQRLLVDALAGEIHPQSQRQARETRRRLESRAKQIPGMRGT